MPAVLASSPSLRNNFGPSAPCPSLFLSLQATSLTLISLATPCSPGFSRDDQTVAEIKGKAKNAVHGVRGASAISLLRSARDQALQGFTLEKDGDLKGALQSFLVSAQLMQLVIAHQEFKQEREGKKGVVWKEFTEFQDVRLSIDHICNILTLIAI